MRIIERPRIRIAREELMKTRKRLVAINEKEYLALKQSVNECLKWSFIAVGISLSNTLAILGMYFVKQ